MDMIPHGDAHLYTNYRNKQKVHRALAYVTLDGIATVYLILGIHETHQFDSGMNVSAGIAGGLLPDLLIGLYNIMKPQWLTWFHDLHFYFHNFIVNRARDVTFSVGLAMQIVLLLTLQARI